MAVSRPMKSLLLALSLCQASAFAAIGRAPRSMTPTGLQKDQRLANALPRGAETQESRGEEEAIFFGTCVWVSSGRGVGDVRFALFRLNMKIAGNEPLFVVRV